MTVVPAGDRTALLICDLCGAEDISAQAAPAGDLVWPLVSELGWSGSAFPTGPHRCPRCSTGEIPPAEPPARPRTYGASYTMRELDGVALVTPLTDLDSTLADHLRDDLMQTAAAHPRVVIDLHAVGFIDSAGLGLLVRARQEARQHDSVLDLAAPSRFVRTVLHTMRLDGAFRIFPDQQAALNE
ncbi:STAS domain-containing protein [Paractinoplanes atraurantiacus]|uniref:Anti-anti-sigma factor n=1 Tax=Paractinoplanes atraurantiacus TaxID=1036182 RepID=A0A285GQ43_9ACTN|nr:STAS domain-containing protein [Actinoplanes atraurantiacus]SNY25657.1 anti-anti-sigma factor [Actinoplanes atraurantiacus]